MSDTDPPPRSSFDPNDVIAMIQERAQRLTLPSWPVFGLVGSSASGWLCGSEEKEDDQLTAVRLDYRPPGTSERLIVQTQPLPNTATAPAVDLGVVLKQLHAGADDGEPLRLRDGAPRASDEDAASLVNETASIDGRPSPALVRRESRASAWSVVADGVIVIVAIRNTVLENLALARVGDLEPFKRERARIVEQYIASQPFPPAPYRG